MPEKRRTEIFKQKFIYIIHVSLYDYDVQLLNAHLRRGQRGWLGDYTFEKTFRTLWIGSHHSFIYTGYGQVVCTDSGVLYATGYTTTGNIKIYITQNKVLQELIYMTSFISI